MDETHPEISIYYTTLKKEIKRFIVMSSLKMASKMVSSHLSILNYIVPFDGTLE